MVFRLEMLGTEMAASTLYQSGGCISEKRDPCASPPCKRLKQAVLPVECIVLDNDTECSSEPLATQTTASKSSNQRPIKENASIKQSPASDKQNIKQCVDSDIASMETESLLVNNTEVKSYAEPPLPCLEGLSETKSDEKDIECVTKLNGTTLNMSHRNTSSLPSSTSNSPKVTKESGTIFRFFQPVTPGSKSKVEHSQTPSKNCRKTPSKGDGDVVGSPCTPVNTKESPDSSEIVANGVTPSPASMSSNEVRKRTPMRKIPGRKLSVEEKLKREEERLRKQKEKEALEKERLEKKKEKERLRLEAKQKKEQEKLEQLEQKKQREKERIEKKEQEDKEKKERLERKEEEKRKKDEERKKKEDEKNLKNEEKRKKEEGEMLKKQKAKNTFASFFIKKEVSAAPKLKEQVPNEAKFQPFELKPFMKLASTPFRKPLSEDAKQQLSKHLAVQATTSLPEVKQEFVALRELVRKLKQEEQQSKVCCRPERNDEDEMIIDVDLSSNAVKTTGNTTENEVNKVTGKLLQFHENYRPAYFGSWRKKSASVGPRTPFKKDEELMNYDVDSDEEWEEEEPGESLSNSEGEDEDEACPNDDEDQDGFFVPHGYLSDDEGDAEIDEEDGMEQDGGGGSGNENFPQSNVEDKMQRHIAKQKDWEAELKRQFKPMKPVAIGCVWDGEIPAILKQLDGCSLVSEDSVDPKSTKRDYHEPVTPSQSTTYCNTAMPVPEEAMPLLIEILHGSAAGLQKLIRVFRERWTLETRKSESVSKENWETHCTVSKRQVERKITTIAHKEVRAALPKPRWYVHPNILALYKMENISLPMNGLATANTKEKPPVPLQTKYISPIISSFTNVKDNSEYHNGVIIRETKSQNTDGTPMDTTPPVRLD